MSGALCDGDLVLGLQVRHTTSISRGDIVVLWSDVGIAIKRVIAVGGDTVEMKNRRVELNGQFLVEPYLCDADGTNEGHATQSDVPFTVPERTFYVLGDNRDISRDSRTFGPVERALMLQKVVFNLSRNRISGCACGK